MALPSWTCTRYITPLREGGSVPALVEADNQGTYVMKLRGAAQGARALVADLVGTELARALGLPVADLVLLNLDDAIARMEPDPEIQQLLRDSVGQNLGVDWLPGSLMFDGAARPVVDAAFAAQVVWLDLWLGNVDRTYKNANLLWWHKRLWLIDQGASLPFHHHWEEHLNAPQRPWMRLADHVLRPWAGPLDAAHALLSMRVTLSLLNRVLDTVPDSWLVAETGLPTPQDHRNAYARVLMDRVSAMPAWWVP